MAKAAGPITVNCAPITEQHHEHPQALVMDAGSGAWKPSDKEAGDDDRSHDCRP